MKSVKALCAPAILFLATCALLLPAPAQADAEASGSDFAFNEMVLEMAGRDTGSMWFDYYVETVNQEIAFKATEEPYGAVSPDGPVSGFDGYVASFIPPDTGSIWFDTYVENVNRLLRDKAEGWIQV